MCTMSPKLRLSKFGEAIETMCSSFWHGGEGREVAVMTSVHGLLRVGSAAQNTRRVRVASFSNTTSRRTRPRCIFTRETEPLLSEF